MSGPAPGVTGTTMVIVRPGACATAVPIETATAAMMMANCWSRSGILLQAGVPDRVMAIPLSACKVANYKSFAPSSWRRRPCGVATPRPNEFEGRTGHAIALSCPADRRAVSAKVRREPAWENCRSASIPITVSYVQELVGCAHRPPVAVPGLAGVFRGRGMRRHGQGCRPAGRDPTRGIGDHWRDRELVWGAPV